MEEEKALTRGLSFVQLLLQEMPGDMTLQEEEIRAIALTVVLETRVEFHSSAIFWT